MESLYNAKNIKISYEPESQVMHCLWRGHQSKEDMIRAGESIYEYLIKKKCKKIFNDNTGIIGPWNHSVEWMLKEWFPLMINEAGLTHFACVLPKNIFARLSARRSLPAIPVIQVFNNYEEARDWLLSDVYV